MLILLAAGVGMGASPVGAGGGIDENEHMYHPRAMLWLREHMRLHGPGAAYPIFIFFYLLGQLR